MLVSDFIKVLPNKAGVYKFFVYSLNKYYIGESVSIRRRVAEHLGGNGKKAIRKAILENGVEDIGFEILHFEDNRDKRIALEQHYKCYYGFDNLLNSISTKDPGSTTRPVLAFTLDGKFAQRFNSVSEAAIYVNKTITSISECCKGKTFECSGFVWLHEDAYTEKKLQQKILKSKVGKIRKRNFLTKLSQKNLEINQKPVLGKNSTEELIFRSVTDAANYLNTSFSNISACCLGKQKRIKSYEWSYINE